MNIDRKYQIRALNPCSGNTHDEHDSILFLAKDKAVPAMLRAYLKESEKLGANPAHLESIGLLIGRVEQYQREVEAKIPDTDLPCEIRRCVDGDGVSDNKQDLAPGAQRSPSFADAYQGAMEEVAIWKKRALEAEDLNRKFVAEINGPTYMGDPAQHAPSVPDGFSREDLEAVADGLDGYEKTVNVGNVTGGGDDHLESTTAYAARFIRAMLAAAPETKP